MKIFAGIVGNSTNTVAVLASERGEILGYGVAGPSNYHIVGLTETIRAIRDSIWDAIIRSEAGLREIHCLTLGLAGLDTRADFERLMTSISQRLPARNVVLRHDSETALAGALAGEPGVIVIAGTGSVAAGMDASGRYVRCGGWGPLLGDEGSSYDIGRQALIAVLREYDGRGEPTALVNLIQEKLGIESIEDIINMAYDRGLGVTEIASIAPLVVKAAEEGDPVAKRIVTGAARALAEMAASVIQRLCLDETDVVKVAIVGSVFSSGKIVVEMFKRYLISYVDNVELITPKLPPVAGALLISYRYSGIQLTDELTKNLEKTLSKIPSQVLEFPP